MTTPEPLSGGMMNAPTRVGDAVRRVATESTPTIHALLRHVRSRGVLWIPEPLGVDGAHEVLGYLPGDVPHDMPSWIWNESTLRDVASRMREWHDATEGFAFESPRWSSETGTSPDVICHNDFAPYNCVFQERRMTGLIDFDLCAPGSRLWDMAYTAYRYVPAMPPEALHEHDETSPFPLDEIRHRLGVFLDAYAAGTPALRFSESDLLASVRTRLLAIAAWTADYAERVGNETLRRNARMYASHAAWIGDEFRSRADRLPPVPIPKASP